MKPKSSTLNLKRKITIGLLIIAIGVVVAYLFYNTRIVAMVLDLFSPYSEQ